METAWGHLEASGGPSEKKGRECNFGIALEMSKGWKRWIGGRTSLAGLDFFGEAGSFWDHPSARTGNLGAVEGTSLTRLGTEQVFAGCLALPGPGTLRARGHRVTQGG